MADILRAPLVVKVQPVVLPDPSVTVAPPLVLATSSPQPLLWAASQL